MRQSNPIMNLHPVPARNILVVVDESDPGAAGRNGSVYLQIIPPNKYPNIGQALNRYYLDNGFMKKIGLPDRYCRTIKRVITDGEVMSETIYYQRVK